MKVKESSLPAEVIYNKTVDRLRAEDHQGYNRERPIAIKMPKYPVIDYDIYMAQSTNYGLIEGELMVRQQRKEQAPAE